MGIKIRIRALETGKKTSDKAGFCSAFSITVTSWRTNLAAKTVATIKTVIVNSFSEIKDVFNIFPQFNTRITGTAIKKTENIIALIEV